MRILRERFCVRLARSHRLHEMGNVMNEAATARRRRGLGMGLSALLGGEEETIAPAVVGAKGIQAVPVEMLTPSPLQPRKRFLDPELDSLAASLREKGVLQPLLVRPAQDASAGYEIVAGERRWRAAQRAGLHELPVIIRSLNDRAVIEVALVENLQREDLTALEEAEAYRRLVSDLGHTQEEVAEAVGKSRSHVANTMRLLALPDEVRVLLQDDRLTAGHARALLGAKDAGRLARLVVERDLNVRETEMLVRREEAVPKATRLARGADPNILDAQERLSIKLGMQVAIKQTRRGGTLEIRYGTLEQLDELLERLAHGDNETFGG